MNLKRALQLICSLWILTSISSAGLDELITDHYNSRPKRAFSQKEAFELENESFNKEKEVADAKKSIKEWKESELKSSERRKERFVSAFALKGKEKESNDELTSDEENEISDDEKDNFSYEDSRPKVKSNKLVTNKIQKKEKLLPKREIASQKGNCFPKGKLSPKREAIASPLKDKESAREYVRNDKISTVGTFPEIEEDRQNVAAFGYDIFLNLPSTFAPLVDIPIPNDYVMGPGDVVLIQCFGKETDEFVLTVNREGEILLPEIGQLTVAGMNFSDMQSLIQKNIKEKMLGVKARVSLSNVRSMKVFILGEATCPGSYTVSSLSTVTNALIASGGIKKTGSLRNIQIKRNGKLVGTLDLYDILLKGNSSSDIRLQSNDIIFIPPVGTMVSIEGAVIRPACYELSKEKTIEEALSLAGGLSQDAYPQKGQIKRLDQKGDYNLKDVDFTNKADLDSSLMNGDSVYVQSAVEFFQKSITLLGHVRHPGGYEWKEGTKLSDIITSKDDLLPKVDLGYALIRRMSDKQNISVFSVDLGDLFKNKNGTANLSLNPSDQIFVFSTESNELRRKFIDQLVDELENQSSLQEGIKVVEISGAVAFPGKYPLEEGMKVADLLRAAGNLKNSAYSSESELTRYTPNHKGGLSIENLKVDLNKINLPNNKENIALKGGDYLTIKIQSDWENRPIVEIVGEVKHPGVYAMKPGETLKDLILRAGGFTQYAFPEGAIFTRETLKDQEEDMLKKMAARLESDLAIFLIQSASGSNRSDTRPESIMTLMKSVLSETKTAKPVGRMIIDMDDIMKDKVAVPVENQDVLLIPKKPVSVAVMGEVQFPSFHVFDPKMKPNEYLEASGGLSHRADKGSLFVVRANGASAYKRVKKTRWGLSGTMQPGDTIIVPIKIEVPSLTLWTQSTQVLYNLSMSAAAIATFKNR